METKRESRQTEWQRDKETDKQKSIEGKHPQTHIYSGKPIMNISKCFTMYSVK